MPTPAASAALFEEHRRHLMALSYRMLGSVAEAEDAVQDTYLRWHAAAAHEIESPKAWLATVCTRRCLDILKEARRKREVYVGPWLPDPLVTRMDIAQSTAAPDVQQEVYESVLTAFLIVLERLTPAERAAFLLKEVFDYGYDDIARILEKNEPACRQLVARAKSHVAENRPRFDVSAERRRNLAQAFFGALRDGDVRTLESVLAKDAEAWSDGGGKTLAARNVIHGAAAVARFIMGIADKRRGDITLAFIELNGMPGAVIRTAKELIGAIQVNVAENGAVSHVFVTVNPDKLGHLDG